MPVCQLLFGRKLKAVMFICHPSADSAPCFSCCLHGKCPSTGSCRAGSIHRGVVRTALTKPTACAEYLFFSSHLSCMSEHNGSCWGCYLMGKSLLLWFMYLICGGGYFYRRKRLDWASCLGLGRFEFDKDWRLESIHRWRADFYHKG